MQNLNKFYIVTEGRNLIGAFLNENAAIMYKNDIDAQKGPGGDETKVSAVSTDIDIPSIIRRSFFEGQKEGN